MKKVLSIIMAVILVTVSLVGCGGNSGTETDKSTSTSTAQATTSSTQPPTTTGNSTQMSWQKDTSPVTLSAFINYSWWPMDVWGKDEVSKEITKQTGVSLEMTKATDANQLKVMLAGNNLPCLVYTDQTALFSMFEKPEVSYAFDDLIKQYAPDLLDMATPLQIFLNKAADGHYYRLKSYFFSPKDWQDPRLLPSPGDPSLHVRADILEALGNPPINSTEDFMKVLQMVKEKYPKMIGYISDPNIGNVFMDYFGLPPAPSTLYKMKDGTVTPGYLNPNMLEYFKYVNQLNNNGYTPKEALTYTYEQFLQQVRSGNVFAVNSHTPFSDEQNVYFEQNKLNGKWAPVLNPLTVNGEMKFHPVNYQMPGWSALFITKSCKNPDRAIRFLEFLMTDKGDQLAQWGNEGKDWTLNSDGYLVRPADFAKRNVADVGVGPNYGLWSFGASELHEGIINSSLALADPKHATAVDVLKERKKHYELDPIITFALPQAGTEQFTIMGKTTDLYTSSLPGIILAASDQELLDKYNQFMSKAKKLGSDSLVQSITSEYKKAEASYNAFMAKNK